MEPKIISVDCCRLKLIRSSLQTIEDCYRLTMINELSVLWYPFILFVGFPSNADIGMDRGDDDDLCIIENEFSLVFGLHLYLSVLYMCVYRHTHTHAVQCNKKNNLVNACRCSSLISVTCLNFEAGQSIIPVTINRITSDNSNPASYRTSTGYVTCPTN